MAEYFDWASAQLGADFQTELDADKMVRRDMTHLELYLPPQGALLLAESGGDVAGMVCVTRLRAGNGEVRRVYVRAPHRRHGLARQLLTSAIQQARQIGYRELQLQGPRTWTGAHALFYELGFVAALPYPESEVPAPLVAGLIFMQLTL